MRMKKQYEIATPNYTRPDIIKEASIGTPSFGHWKALFTSILKSVEPDAKMIEDFTANKTGLGYIFAQALRVQNPAFFDALTKTVMKHSQFVERLAEKLPLSVAIAAAEKSGASNPLYKISFTDLCDSEQYALRGRVRSLMGSFRHAMNFADTSLSDLEKTQIENFIASVEAASQPVEYDHSAALKQRVPV